MDNLFADFESELTPKKEISPADAFLEKQNRLIAQREAEVKKNLSPETQQAREKLRKNPLTPDECYPAIRPSKEFDSMPLGLKEAQERNGVYDHGLGIIKKGNFVWADPATKDKVIFQEDANGAFALADPNNPNAATKDLLNRKFPNAEYYGTAGIDPIHIMASKDDQIMVVKRMTEEGDGTVVAMYEGRNKKDHAFWEDVIMTAEYYNTEVEIEEDGTVILSKRKFTLPEELQGVTLDIPEATGFNAVPVQPPVKDNGQAGLFDEERIVSRIEELKQLAPTNLINEEIKHSAPKIRFVNPTQFIDEEQLKPIEEQRYNVEKITMEEAARRSNTILESTVSLYDNPEKQIKAVKGLFDDFFTVPEPPPAEDVINYGKINESSFDGSNQPDFHLDEAGLMQRLNEVEINPTKEETTMLKKALQQSEPSFLDADREKTRIKSWVGIDPGKAGGIVAITEQGIVGKWSIPLIGKDVDAQGLWMILDNLKKSYDITVILEEVHSLHKMAASTNFSMGHTLGIILGIVISSQLRLIRVQPKAWQKKIWITSEIEYLPKKPDQTNPSVNTKLTSMKAAHRIFPNQDFRKSTRAKNPDDGICDAACLSEYGRRKNL